MIITEEEFKRQFGPNARLANQPQNGQVASDYHDVQQEGHVDEDGYFHPIGSQTIQERNKWQSLKKGLPAIQRYINAGVPEQVLRSTIERLSKECAVYGESGHVTTKKVMDKLAEIFNRNAKFYEEKPNIEKAVAEKPKMTAEEEEKVIAEMAHNMKKPGLMDRFFISRPPFLAPPVESIDLDRVVPPNLSNFKIKLSGGIIFDNRELESCIGGLLKLKTHKRAIKLNRKQIKELESQL